MPVLRALVLNNDTLVDRGIEAGSRTTPREDETVAF
jgi:hypothetical protein